MYRIEEYRFHMIPHVTPYYSWDQIKEAGEFYDPHEAIKRVEFMGRRHNLIGAEGLA